MSKLIECPMCEKMISPNATACPNCGEPMSNKPQEAEIIETSKYDERADLILLEVGGYPDKVRRALTGVGYYSADKLNSIMNDIPHKVLKSTPLDLALKMQGALEESGATVKVIFTETEDELSDTFKNEFKQMKKTEEDFLKEIEIKSSAKDEVRCPKCKSTQLSANKKGFGLGKAAVGAVIAGPVGLLGGFVGSGKVKVTCLKCGHTFNVGK